MKDNFDWFKWAGISESNTDKLLTEAKKEGVFVFDTDTDKDVFDRLLSVKSNKWTRRLMKINIFLTLISCTAAVVSVVYTVKATLV